MGKLVADIPVTGLWVAVTEDPCCVETMSCWGTSGTGRLLLPARACLCQLLEGQVPGGCKFPHLERMSS